MRNFRQDNRIDRIIGSIFYPVNLVNPVKNSFRSLAFTLIEMLIVILVIAILAGMLFPVLFKAKSWAREKQAMMEIKNIEIAIKAYHAVYGKWPNQTQSVTDACYVADNAAVIAALTNNPRSMVFLHFQQSAISTNDDTRGSYLDPWLHPYVIAIDDSCDNKIAVNQGGIVTANPPTNITVILTNLNEKVTTNAMNFVANFTIGVFSWGNRDIPVTNNQENYLNMDLCSWQMGIKTK